MAHVEVGASLTGSKSSWGVYMTLGTSPCLNFPNCKMGIIRVTSGLLQGLKDATGISCPGIAQDIKCLTDLQGLVEYSRKWWSTRGRIVLPRRTTVSLLGNTGSPISNLLDALGSSSQCEHVQNMWSSWPPKALHSTLA